MMYDVEKKTIDARNVLAAGMHQNRRNTLPKPGKATEEAMNETRKKMWKNVYNKYKKERCNEKGEIKEKNLTKEEIIGMKKTNEEEEGREDSGGDK